MTDEFRMFDDRKRPDESECKKKKIPIYHARKIRDPRTLKMPVRDEKVMEIKEIWESPKFKTHNQRLIYLLKHCTIIEPQYGYTIREFAHAIHPQKMDPNADPMNEYDSEYYAFKALRKMFNRFSHDVTNHEVLLSAVLAKGTGKWYYYNIIDDEQAIKDHHLRLARMSLGFQRTIQELEHIAEHSEEIEREHKAELEDILRRARIGRKQKRDKMESELKRNPLKVKRERDECQKTLD